jgi:hypothetical protein
LACKEEKGYGTPPTLDENELWMNARLKVLVRGQIARMWALEVPSLLHV